MEAGERLEKALKLIFPPRCIFCGGLLEPGQEHCICRDCFVKIPFSSGEAIRTANCRSGGCDYAVSACRYTGIVKDSLIRFKFYNKPGYYRTFADILLDRLSQVSEGTGIDLITSVPLHKDRQRERGYNQAALLAGEISRKTGIPDCRKLLSRVKRTEVQSLLPGNEREMNVRGAFKVGNAAKVSGRTVLLIDDVLTTGSTVDECSRILKEAGAVRVIAAVIATGRKY